MVRPTRGRDVASPDGGLVGADLYEVLGDPEGALASMRSNKASRSGPNDAYNQLLLSHLATIKDPNAAAGDLVAKLKGFDTKQQATANDKRNAPPSARKRKRKEWILTYNRALALHAAGDAKGSIELCLEKLKPVVLNGQNVSEDLINVYSQMAFLLLEGIITTSVGCHEGLEQVDGEVTSSRVVAWLDLLDLEKEPQVKFLLALYKSRLDFQERDGSGRLVDQKIRSARKELKQAMEIFQQKLKPSSGDLASVDSSFSEENVSSSGAPSQQQTPMSRILQRQNQAALNLKANTEQLKGNIKKSLILCGEAQAAVSEEDNSSYAALHATNLANVYETNGRRHLALHMMGKALRSDPPTAPFDPDGTAKPDQTLRILYNASIASALAQNYVAAYECMANCVRHSNVMSKRPRCWLRLAEACIGVHSKRKQDADGKKLSKVVLDGKNTGILLEDAPQAPNAKDTLSIEYIKEVLGTEGDIGEMQTNPLCRARAALGIALALFEGTAETDVSGFASARLSMSYVCLEYRDFQAALDFAKLILDNADEQVDASDNVGRSLWQRQQATARMYAAEASCALGDAVGSMRFLAGDGKNDAFDRLASALGGVTLEIAASSGQGKARLARAQAMVRSSASAASAGLGNLAAAKKFAVSAQAMEGAYSADKSYARRALVYCMLREGNCGAALSVLRSAR